MSSAEVGPVPRARVVLVGIGPTTLDALDALADRCEVVALIRPGDDDTTARAAKLGIPVEPGTRVADIEAVVERLAPDAVVVSSYDRILPDRLLARCPFVNVHYSPLPRGRGRANVNWAIINGDTETAITVHTMAPGLDAGGILHQEPVPIGPRDTVTDLYDRLNARQRAVLADAVLRRLTGDEGDPQDHGQATYGCTRLPEDGEIDWSAPTADTDRLVRSLTPPYPGAFTHLGLEPLRILRAEPSPDAPRYTGRVPGRVVLVDRSGEGWVEVLTGDGVLRVHEVAQGDGPPVPANTVVKSVKTTLGVRTADLLAALAALRASGTGPAQG
ncbi:methionyl-tRNA formyltransferase [Yinghuangia seranimata]|uniref:methionyl-tRNA formyltransferase n=1 Tax=Yinghuangia seranimata TaxID=408067 RepID=UPI00248D2C38|nr:methionyl-tRNA formyltransferase [Yinghuangia seranimata]MDI2126740.1 methionyl-tRNA formyltransferase [Yinghuangia seranimata]